MAVKVIFCNNAFAVRNCCRISDDDSDRDGHDDGEDIGGDEGYLLKLME